MDNLAGWHVVILASVLVWIAVLAWFITRLARQRITPTAKVLLWVIAVLAFPVVGLIAYAVIGARSPATEP